jgi:hypothetical protein
MLEEGGFGMRLFFGYQAETEKVQSAAVEFVLSGVWHKHGYRFKNFALL